MAAGPLAEEIGIDYLNIGTYVDLGLYLWVEHIHTSLCDGELGTKQHYVSCAEKEGWQYFFW